VAGQGVPTVVPALLLAERRRGKPKAPSRYDGACLGEHKLLWVGRVSVATRRFVQVQLYRGKGSAGQALGDEVAR
jgi:hypothetical protein